VPAHDVVDLDEEHMDLYTLEVGVGAGTSTER
jgi:hypothetical protein